MSHNKLTFRVAATFVALSAAVLLTSCKPHQGNPAPVAFLQAPGDVFLGSWTNRDTTQFTITKAGDKYLVHSVNTTGMLNGTFPCDYANGTLVTRSMFGDLTYVKQTDSIYWVGNQFTRQQ